MIKKQKPLKNVEQFEFILQAFPVVKGKRKESHGIESAIRIDSNFILDIESKDFDKNLNACGQHLFKAVSNGFIKKYGVIDKIIKDNEKEIS